MNSDSVFVHMWILAQDAKQSILEEVENSVCALQQYLTRVLSLEHGLHIDSVF